MQSRCGSASSFTAAAIDFDAAQVPFVPLGPGDTMASHGADNSFTTDDSRASVGALGLRVAAHDLLELTCSPAPFAAQRRCVAYFDCAVSVDALQRVAGKPLVRFSDLRPRAVAVPAGGSSVGMVAGCFDVVSGYAKGTYVPADRALLDLAPTEGQPDGILLCLPDTLEEIDADGCLVTFHWCS